VEGLEGGFDEGAEAPLGGLVVLGVEAVVNFLSAAFSSISLSLGSQRSIAASSKSSGCGISA